MTYDGERENKVFPSIPKTLHLYQSGGASKHGFITMAFRLHGSFGL